MATPCGFESHHRHQLRNSRHRSVSGFAENCAMVGISSLSAPIRLAGFGAEGRRGGGLGAVSFLSRIDKEGDRHCLSLFLVPPPLPLAKTGRCGVLIEIVQEKSTKVFPPPLFLADVVGAWTETGGYSNENRQVSARSLPVSFFI